MGLWNDYQAKKKDSIIERLYQQGRIKKRLYFPGTILLDPRGDLRVLYLYRSDGGEWWGWGANWLGRHWHAECLAALLQV